MFGSTFVPGGGGAPAPKPEVISFTPSWASGVTVGNGVQIGLYTLNGKRCSGNVKLTLGSTSVIGTDVILYSPLPMHPSLQTYMTIGAVGLIDAGISLYMGEAIVHYQPSGLISARVINASGTYAVWGYVSAGVPFAWASGDMITIEFDYLTP